MPKPPKGNDPGLFGPRPDDKKPAKKPDAGLAAGQARRDRGAQAALDKSGDWGEAAYRHLLELAATGRAFNADDLRELAGAPASANAMGGVFLRGVRSRVIEAVGLRKMQRAKAHARKTFVYRGTGTAAPDSVS